MRTKHRGSVEQFHRIKCSASCTLVWLLIMHRGSVEQFHRIKCSASCTLVWLLIIVHCLSVLDDVVRMLQLNLPETKPR